MDFDNSQEIMLETLRYELDNCDDYEDRERLRKILISPGAYDYYSQINGEYAIDSYEFLYQYFANKNGNSQANDCIDEMIRDLIMQFDL